MLKIDRKLEVRFERIDLLSTPLAVSCSLMLLFSNPMSKMTAAQIDDIDIVE